ncbi:MAG: ATP-binding cassette domain-containing protein, partial [Pseudomonadota bacterium]
VDNKDAVELAVTHGSVVFDAVKFHYGGRARSVKTAQPDTDPPVIHDFSLSVKPGEKIGLVGRSGAGKSTLVNLLLRFYDIDDGRISIDRQDIAQVTQDSLRANIAMVSQDTSLLHRSIRDNIRYGLPAATDDQIIRATELASADQFIPLLEDGAGRRGFDAFVGERGVKLSGGQRQRIAIARVILKDAPILVLDEATSALDSEVEAAIQEQLNDLMAGKTVLAIAHRLSTIAAMDRLVVMDAGEIVEIGSHEQLLQRNGLYAQLWNRQSGGFLGSQ